MPPITQGRIVYPVDPIPDPQGRNPKSGRPFVVVSDPQSISTGGAVRLVGISRDVYGKAEEVELPWGPSCLTHLRQKSAAICSWVVEVPQDKVAVSKGIVPPVPLKQILKRIAGR